MRIFEEYIDEIFEAIYGKSISPDTGKSYTEQYSLELDNIYRDFVNAYECYERNRMELTHDCIKFLILTSECNHINNKLNINKDMLNTVAYKIMEALAQGYEF